MGLDRNGNLSEIGIEIKRNGDLDESLDKNFHLNPHPGW
jgi:hypothetical protein